MNHLQVWPYRFHFLARAPAVFPQHQSGNILRGAFGTIFRRIACEPQCPGSLQCEIAQDCPYAQVFEPRWPAGPSGLADPPRAFVFRPTGLEGRNLQPGEPFWFDLHLFSPALTYSLTSSSPSGSWASKASGPVAPASS